MAELQTEHIRRYIAIGRKEQECWKLERLQLIIILKMRKQGLAMIHTHYAKVMNMEESVDDFAQLDRRML